jgi:hypothetical protein
MIKALIKIRVKQIYRGLIGIGLIRLIFIIGLLGSLSFILFNGVADGKSAYYLAMGNIIIYIFIQVRRQDKTFLQTHFLAYRFIFCVEYLLLSIPMVVSLFYHQKWIQLVIIAVRSLTVPLLDYKPRKRSLNSKLQQIIPSDSYEWKAGSRKLLFVILTLWIIGLCTSFLIGSVPVVILIIGFVVLSFYESCEPYQMIIASEMSSGKFLLQKVKLQSMIFTAITLPLIIAFVLFQTEYLHDDDKYK